MGPFGKFEYDCVLGDTLSILNVLNMKLGILVMYRSDTDPCKSRERDETNVKY